MNNLPLSVLMRPVLSPPPASDSLTTEPRKRRGRVAAAMSPRSGGPRLRHHLRTRVRSTPRHFLGKRVKNLLTSSYHFLKRGL